MRFPKLPSKNSLRHEFLKAGNEIIPLSRIDKIDIDQVEQEHVTIHHGGKTSEAYGHDAIEAVMMLKPSALEGRRMKWHKHMWAVHNLVGHPLMQVLAWAHFYKAAIRVHDATTPVPQSGHIPKPPKMN